MPDSIGTGVAVASSVLVVAVVLELPAAGATAAVPGPALGASAPGEVLPLVLAAGPPVGAFVAGALDEEHPATNKQPETRTEITRFMV